MVVFDDADPEAVAEGIKIAGYANSGQDCTAGSRVIAGPKIYDALLEALVPAVESLNVGDPASSEEIEMGPVISADQQERIFGFLERAKGATVLTGGEAKGDRGWFVTPTVVTDVAQDDEIVQNEVFGPVVTVQKFADDAQAIEWANGVRYGLAASVWTRDIGRALSAARKLQFGTVWINDHLVPISSEMPHGGYKKLRLRQGHVGVLDGGVHADQARGREARLELAQLGQLVRRRRPFAGGRVGPHLFGLGRARDHRDDRGDRSQCRRSPRRGASRRALPPTARRRSTCSSPSASIWRP